MHGTHDTDNSSFISPVTKTDELHTRAFEIPKSAKKVVGTSSEFNIQTRLAHAETYGHDVTRFAMQRLEVPKREEEEQPLVQTKLTIGQVGDKYEQEADEMAQRVMAMGEDDIAEEQKDFQEEQHSPKLQAKGKGKVLPSGFEQQLVSNKGSGQPLSDKTRAFMEPRFGADFSGVKIHQEPALTSAIQAQAFTHGKDIYFNALKYSPETDGGKELLAHELTHVVQQMGSGQTKSVQKFESPEHKILGDVGSNERTYDFPSEAEPSSREGKTMSSTQLFKLTHGDITMLSGDYFDPRSKRINSQGKEEIVQDSLFRLAAIPSSDFGKQKNTQDEIIYAIKVATGSGDPRFSKDFAKQQPEGGIWSRIDFSDDVMEAVNSRYKRLAADNSEHFVEPKKDAPSNGKNRSSAAGSYRSMHEGAIIQAFLAGQSGEKIDNAMAYEAAGQHFLTDHFASGHLRTPRLDIQEYWGNKYPLFFENLKKKIGLDVARYINEKTTNVATIAGTVSQINNEIMGQINQKTKDIPEIGFGDLISMIAHDFDNEQGLWVTNDRGDVWKTFGDGALLNKKSDPKSKKEHNKTAELAILAVQLGCRDIEYAYALGAKQPDSFPEQRILNIVQHHFTDSGKSNGKYSPERVLPRLDPIKNNGTQNWKAASFDELLSIKVSSNYDQNYEQAIREMLKPNRTLTNELKGIGKMFPRHKKIYKGGICVGTVYPSTAYEEGFLQSLLSQPITGIRDIIDFNPSRGQAYFNEDDAVMEELPKEAQEGKENQEKTKETYLSGLTLHQRADRINALIGGWGWTGEDEGERVIDLFKSASANDRPQLYRLVEGHAWTGDWIRGWLTSDDNLWNALYRNQLDRLRNIINND